jgi:hypothetical protein
MNKVLSKILLYEVSEKIFHPTKLRLPMKYCVSAVYFRNNRVIFYDLKR